MQSAIKFDCKDAKRSLVGAILAEQGYEGAIAHMQAVVRASGGSNVPSQ